MKRQKRPLQMTLWVNDDENCDSMPTFLHQNRFRSESIHWIAILFWTSGMNPESTIRHFWWIVTSLMYRTSSLGLDYATQACRMANGDAGQSLQPYRAFSNLRQELEESRLSIWSISFLNLAVCRFAGTIEKENAQNRGRFLVSRTSFYRFVVLRLPFDCPIICTCCYEWADCSGRGANADVGDSAMSCVDLALVVGEKEAD